MTRSAFLTRILAALPFLGWVLPKMGEAETSTPTESIWPKSLEPEATWLEDDRSSDHCDVIAGDGVFTIRTRYRSEGGRQVQEWSVLDAGGKELWRGDRVPVIGSEF